MSKPVRIRTNVWHHCLVPIQAILSGLESFEDLAKLSLKLASCDPSALDGHVSVAKAALTLGLSDAQLSAILDLTSDFATGAARPFFVPQHEKVHIYGICTALFIQLFGRHVNQQSGHSDHWPLFQGGKLSEGESEQVDLKKSTPSRSRSSNSTSSSGPTKAHKLHLRHVMKQFQAVEKGLADFVARFAVPFLELLCVLTDSPTCNVTMLTCLGIVLEHHDTTELDCNSLVAISDAGEFDAKALGQALGPQIILAASSSQWRATRPARVDEDSMSDASSMSGVPESVSDTESRGSSAAQISAVAGGVPEGSAQETLGWSKQDIIGASRTTVLRGESDIVTPSLTIVGCHESCVYCLAPMRYVLISCCTDCIIVVGACGASIRVEHCERVHIVAATVRLTIATCHDCNFNIACNTQPVLAGDNRFIQVAPFNAQYEHLPRHLKEVSVARVPNHWNNPLEMARDSYQLMSPQSSPRAPDMKCPVVLMPPEDFLPFMIPFKGGPGPLCGGASTETFQWSPGSYFNDKQVPSRAQPDIFPLPKAYSDALQSKIVRVANMRSAVKTSFLDSACKQEVQAVIQAYFKEWLMSSNNIRQVYDLARLEREHSKTIHRSSSRSTKASNATHEPS